MWKQRDLSLKGKITIINSLALCPIIYLSSIIDTPDLAIKEIEKLITDFIWAGKTPKIAKNTLIQNIPNGGLKLCSYGEKVKALLLSWVKRLTTSNQARWSLIPKYMYKTNDLYEYFSYKHQPMKKNDIPLFYKNIHNLWGQVYNSEPTNTKDIYNEILWNNQYILVKGETLFWKNWKEKGILKIRHLFNAKGDPLSHAELTAKYKVKCDFLSLLKIRQCIPRNWKKELQNNKAISEDAEEIILKIDNKKLNIMSLKCRDFYWLLINRMKHIPTCKIKWLEHFHKLEQVDYDIWERIFKLAFSVTRETKIQSFQYRIIHRIIPCNKWLFNIKIRNSDQCNYCSETDDLKHFFIHCEKVKDFWRSVFSWWNRISDVKFKGGGEITECILFGFPGPEDIITVLNYIVLLAKFYIYKQRLFKENDVNQLDFLFMLKHRLMIEKTICTQECKETNFQKYNFVYNNL